MIAPQRYRKLPVEIEAIQWTGSNIEAVKAFVGGDMHRLVDDLYIETMEGRMKAPVGWWIIRGVAGEFYPCAPEVFTATYEAVLDGE